MHALYLASVWLHILAASTWIGGTMFIMLVVVPWLRASGGAGAGRFLRETGQRFRSVAWVSFAVLLVTGVFNLWVRGVRPADFARLEWLTSPFGTTVMLKLGLFASVLALSAVHDFLLGPRATLAMERDPRSPEVARLRRQAALLGRANAVLGLVLMALGVMLVRGSLW